MILTRCPIDGSRIRRNPEGEIECTVALIGNHSEAIMRRAYVDSLTKASGSAEKPRYYGDPCPTCGKPKQTVIDPSGDNAAYAVCGPCRGLKGGRRSPNPRFAQWTIQGPDKQGYYFEGNVMTR